MSAYTNVSIPNRIELDLDRNIATLTAERDFWRYQALQTISALGNVPRALSEYGACEIKDQDGDVWHLRLDPDKHPVHQ